ncbi:hypothetical protein MMC09_005481 [Bachmanniomyces sp. S44760]|nr:hypothetical protein [Bachmanniomyces sp. S44760]
MDIHNPVPDGNNDVSSDEVDMLCSEKMGQLDGPSSNADDVPTIPAQKYTPDMGLTPGLSCSPEDWVLFDPEPKDLPTSAQLIRAGNTWSSIVPTYIHLSDFFCSWLILKGKSTRDLHTFYRLDFGKEKIYKTQPNMGRPAVDVNSHFCIFKGYVLHGGADLDGQLFDWSHFTVNQEYLVQIVSPRSNASNRDATPPPVTIIGKTTNIPKPQIQVQGEYIASGCLWKDRQVVKEYTDFTPMKKIILGLRKGSAVYKAKQIRHIKDECSDLDTLSPQDSDSDDKDEEVPVILPRTILTVVAAESDKQTRGQSSNSTNNPTDIDNTRVQPTPVTQSDNKEQEQGDKSSSDNDDIVVERLSNLNKAFSQAKENFRNELEEISTELTAMKQIVVEKDIELTIIKDQLKLFKDKVQQEQ